MNVSSASGSTNGTPTTISVSDEDRVEERYERHPAQISAQRRPRAIADCAGVVTVAGRHEIDDPAPDALTVLEQEEQQDERKRQSDDDLEQQRCAADRALGDPRGVVTDLLLGALQPRI
jgi:hypothetical protein